MRSRIALWHVPVRLATGAFIINSGVSKLKADSERATQLHGFATTAYPEFKQLTPETFTTVLAAGEIALGTALVAPMVPPGVAGLGLTAFAGGLIGLYFKVPGMRQQESVRPTERGLALAKDSWLFSIGLALVLDAITATPQRRRKRKAAAKAKKTPAKAGTG